jgi:hypothetical protein
MVMSLKFNSSQKAKGNVIDWNQGEDQELSFGKWEGSTLQWVSVYHPYYFLWMCRVGIVINCPAEVQAAIEDSLDEEYWDNLRDVTVADIY